MQLRGFGRVAVIPTPHRTVRGSYNPKSRKWSKVCSLLTIPPSTTNPLSCIVYKPGKVRAINSKRSSHGLTSDHIAQVAIVLQGRQAGRKVVVIKQNDEGTKERPFPHAVVAGIERYPLKVTKRMGAKKRAKRSKVKPFIKVRFQVECPRSGWGSEGVRAGC